MRCLNPLLLCLMLFTLTQACQNETASSSQPPQLKEAPVTLKTYQTKSAQSDRLRAILTRVLQKNGSVESLPGGQLVVVAPAHIHEGLEAFFAQGPKLETKARDSVRVRYWLVFGRTKEQANKVLPPSQVSGEGVPKEVLSMLQGASGYDQFTLLEHVQVVSLDGELAQAQGKFMSKVSQTVSVRDGQYEALLKMHVNPSSGGEESRLSTTVRLKDRDFVVLGQAGATLPTGEQGSLFYVVRAEVQS